MGEVLAWFSFGMIQFGSFLLTCMQISAVIFENENAKDMALFDILAYIINREIILFKKKKKN